MKRLIKIWLSTMVTALMIGFILVPTAGAFCTYDLMHWVRLQMIERWPDSRVALLEAPSPRIVYLRPAAFELYVSQRSNESYSSWGEEVGAGKAFEMWDYDSKMMVGVFDVPAGDLIHISIDTDQCYQDSVVVHELVHYCQLVVGYLPNFTLEEYVQLSDEQRFVVYVLDGYCEEEAIVIEMLFQETFCHQQTIDRAVWERGGG